jgi:hypothetical protein
MDNSEKAEDKKVSYFFDGLFFVGGHVNLISASGNSMQGQRVLERVELKKIQIKNLYRKKGSYDK